MSMKKIAVLMAAGAVLACTYLYIDPGEAPDREPAKLVSAGGLESVAVMEKAAGEILSRNEIDFNHLPRYFQSEEISTQLLERIAAKSYTVNPDVSIGQLRYIKVLHYNFDHQIQVGELIVNSGLAEDFQEIFRKLFEAEYEIQSIRLIDDYWTGDGESTDNASVQENNSSAFCYREITGGAALSNHALGCAVDINPQQNPYIRYQSGEAFWTHENADSYVDRTAGLPHMITHDDLCCQIFQEHGFTWGGDWENPKDYQHFEKKI